jgi:hypothetical protein
MGITIKGKGLLNFQKKLNNADFTELKNDVAQAIADRGVEIAKEKYGSESIQVSAELIGDGRAKIIAKGDQIGYLEFGTGIQGEGQYPKPESLPTKTLQFESPKGVSRETKGWVYNYMKKLYHPENKDVTGRPPKAQMFYTAQELKQEKKNIIKKVLRGDK